MKTIHGIYNDINESDYVVVKNKIKFYFSSEVYARKFSERVDKYVQNELAKYNNKFDTVISGELLYLLDYYRRIEKRGFRIVYDNLEINDMPLFRIEIGSQY